MKTVQSLIAKAREKVHTDRELAASLGIHPPELNDMKKGKRPISPEMVAALCTLAEVSADDAREWLAVSLIENPKNSSRAEVLRKAFFASSIGALALSLISGKDADAQTAKCATIQGIEVCPANGLNGEQQHKKDAETKEAARLKKPACKGGKWIEPDGWACPVKLPEPVKKSEANFPSFGTLATVAERLYIMSTAIRRALASLQGFGNALLLAA